MIEPFTGSAYFNAIKRAAAEVDTWPDWKLDSAGLRSRSRRRAAGEDLPKPTKEMRRIAELEAEVLALRQRELDPMWGGA